MPASPLALSTVLIGDKQVLVEQRDVDLGDGTGTQPLYIALDELTVQDAGGNLVRVSPDNPIPTTDAATLAELTSLTGTVGGNLKFVDVTPPFQNDPVVTAVTIAPGATAQIAGRDASRTRLDVYCVSIDVTDAVLWVRWGITAANAGAPSIPLQRGVGLQEYIGAAAPLQGFNPMSDPLEISVYEWSQ